MENFEGRVLALKEYAATVTVVNEEERFEAGATLMGIKGLIKEVKLDREGERLAAVALKDAIVAARNRHLKPLERAETLIKAAILAYEVREEQQRKAEEDRINQERIDQEEGARLAEAAELQELGEPEKAQEVLAAPAPVSLVHIPKTSPKVEGQHVLTLWKVRKTSLMDLAKAVVAGEVSSTYLEINQVYANAEVKRLKEEFDVPGLEAYTEKSLASRSW